jgi:tetratricopeptide (TPR) repeat protein
MLAALKIATPSPRSTLTSGMHRKAIEKYKEAIRIKPGFAAAHYNLAITYLILNERNAALYE